MMQIQKSSRLDNGRDRWPRKVTAILALAAAATALCGCGSGGAGSSAASTSVLANAGNLSIVPGALPRPDHVVVVMDENRASQQVIGNPQAPYINSLAAQGALFTQSFALFHPSQPNYIALLSGSNQGITDDACPATVLATPNLASELLAANLSFGSYSESLPAIGSMVCTAGLYAVKHNAMVNWQGGNIPPTANMPFTSFPTDFTELPTISFVAANLMDDMHDGTIPQGDAWMQANIDAYAQWAKTHNSLLIFTFDEDDKNHANQIPTIFVGQMVKPGNYSERIDHYSVLRTILDMYGLPQLGNSVSSTPIRDVWQ